MGSKLLYNAIENTIIKYVIKECVDNKYYGLHTDIKFFIEKVFLKHLNKEYMDNSWIIINSLIDSWIKDSTKTAGHLTREIINVMEIFELAYLRDKQINDILE